MGLDGLLMLQRLPIWVKHRKGIESSRSLSRCIWVWLNATVPSGLA